MAHLADYNIENQFEAKVLKTKRLTPIDTEEIREIQLEVNEAEFVSHVNQSFGVLVDSSGEFGNSKHHRLYSVADLPEQKKGKTNITFLVKRCSYVDDFNGEMYNGVASHYLCDRKAGDKITLTGPFAHPFSAPEDKNANIIMVGMGTGIAPFRAFIKNLYSNEKHWQGKVRLFYGARSGLEMLYLNDKDGDLTNYYDEDTFQAFRAVSPRPNWDPIALDHILEEESEELFEMLSQANTYVYVAGYEKIRDNLNKAFSKIMGSKEKWDTRKAELIAGKKWAEVIY